MDACPGRHGWRLPHHQPPRALSPSKYGAPQSSPHHSHFKLAQIRLTPGHATSTHSTSQLTQLQLNKSAHLNSALKSPRCLTRSQGFMYEFVPIAHLLVNAICLLISATFHGFNCIDEHAHYNLRIMDFCGIGVGILSAGWYTVLSFPSNSVNSECQGARLAQD